MLEPPIPVPLSTPDPLVEVKLSDLQMIRDTLGRLPERFAANGNLLRHLYAQVAEIHRKALAASKSRASAGLPVTE
jgi:hypothetical protein